MKLGTHLGVALTAVSLLSAQERTPEATFQVDTALHQIEVRVKDRKGQPVSDLTREAFTLNENGEPQKIATFEYFGPRNITTIAKTDLPLDQPPVETSPVTTRIYIATDVAPPTPTCGSTWEYELFFRGVEKFLDHHWQPGTEVSFNGTPFTSDRDKLSKTWELMRRHPNGRSSPDKPDWVPAFITGHGTMQQAIECDSWIVANTSLGDPYTTTEQVVRPSPDFLLQLGRSNLERYIDVVRKLGELPGKKIVVLLSRGLMVGRENKSALNRLAREALRSRVTFYSVIPTALSAPNGNLAKGGGGARHTRGLFEIAENTGGKAIHSTNDFSDVFQRVYADNSDYYLLGYYPSDRAEQGRFRKISVSVNRPNLRVESTKGYYEAEPFADRVEVSRKDAGILQSRVTRAVGESPSRTTKDAPPEALSSYERAFESLRSQPDNLDAPISDLKAAVSAYPQFAIAWTLLGSLRSAQGDTDAARQAFAQAIESDPDYASPYEHLLRMEVRLQDWAAARTTATQLLERNPDEDETIYYLALSDYNLGHIDAATAWSRRLIERGVAEKFPHAQKLLGLIREAEGEYSLAARDFRRYLEIVPDARDRREVEKQIAEWERRVEAQTVSSSGLRVTNHWGNVIVRVGRETSIQLRSSSEDRKLRRGDVVMTEQPGLVEVETNPGDGAPVDLEIDVPYGTAVGIQTGSGSISLTGLIFRADLITDSGDVFIALPWDTTRFVFTADREPIEFIRPEGLEVRVRRNSSRSGKTVDWQANDLHKAQKVTYGGVQLDAAAPGKVVLEQLSVPADSPVKMPWHAPALLRQMRSQSTRPGTPLRLSSRENDSALSNPRGTGVQNRDVVFTSDVRMVNLSVSITGQNGKRVEDLEADDFAVTENGKRQNIAALRDSEASFNLAILLDLSASTVNSREIMREAARRFVGIARAQDRVAVYALVNSFFWELSPLTANHEALQKRIDALPDLSGASPLYDSLITAYSHELWNHPGERNALVVLTDGLDNSRGAPGSRPEPGLAFRYGVPSQTTERQLLAAAKEMDVLLYPVLLPSVLREPSTAMVFDIRNLFRDLAQTTGGRAFSTSSLDDLEPVYSQIAEELRSVYSVSYYPVDQDFDGSWRELSVQVETPNIVVRTRPGYWAK